MEIASDCSIYRMNPVSLFKYNPIRFNHIVDMISNSPAAVGFTCKEFQLPAYDI